MQTDNLIGMRPHSLDRLGGGGHRHRADEVPCLLGAHRVERRDHRGGGRESVVDDDDDAPWRIER